MDAWGEATLHFAKKASGLVAKVIAGSCHPATQLGSRLGGEPAGAVARAASLDGRGVRRLEILPSQRSAAKCSSGCCGSKAL